MKKYCYKWLVQTSFSIFAFTFSLSLRFSLFSGCRHPSPWAHELAIMWMVRWMTLNYRTALYQQPYPKAGGRRRAAVAAGGCTAAPCKIGSWHLLHLIPISSWLFSWLSICCIRRRWALQESRGATYTCSTLYRVTVSWVTAHWPSNPGGKVYSVMGLHPFLSGTCIIIIIIWVEVLALMVAKPGPNGGISYLVLSR